MSADVTDNAAEHRFELKAGDRVAVAYYTLAPGVITFTYRGATSLVWAGHRLEARARRPGTGPGSRVKVVPKCPFVAAFIVKNAEFADLVL